jgi:hypothetical protein
MPKGITFFIGTLSMIVAAGILLSFTRFSGVSVSELGVVPKLHLNIAPLHTAWGTADLLKQHETVSSTTSVDWIHSVR